MRCPKCGYISFDHVKSCLKCKKGLSGETEVEGTTYRAVSPSFLRVPERNSYEEDDESVRAEKNDISLSENNVLTEEDYDFSDPDLDVLAVEDEEDEGAISFAGTGNEDFFLETEEESGEEGNFEFDLDDDSVDFSAEGTEDDTVLSLPDELADISDLAPPEDMEATVISPAAMDLTVEDILKEDDSLDDLGGISMDLELDMLETSPAPTKDKSPGDFLDGLDSDLGLGETENLSEADVSLSLDGLDLTVEDILKEDDSLDDIDGISMDLEIDTLETSPLPTKDKSPGDLDHISLTLD